jgi:hypothetical protein
METDDGRIAIFVSRASEELPWFAADIVFALLAEALTDFDASAE